MRIPRPLTILALLGLLLGGPLVAAPRPVAAEGAACFAETNQCIQGRFLAYWTANGGLARNGFPLTAERQELLEDGNTYTVQYFERVRMEYHPENQPPYDVLLGQFGRRVLLSSLSDQNVYRSTTAPAAPQAGATYFPETGHNLGGPFLEYWQANGGLAQFGYPISEQSFRVQYFERARLEWHTENAGTPYEFLLGQIGRLVLAENDLLTGDFQYLYTANEAVRAALGPPRARAAQSQGATQAFQRGRMFYQGDQRRIYALCGDQQAGQVVVSGVYPDPQRLFFVDTWEQGQDPGGGAAPVAGLFLPQRGLGKVWRENQAVRDCLDYALTADETGYALAVQEFKWGVMLADPEGRYVYVVSAQSARGRGLAGSYARYDGHSR
jgi:hypothetical protein